jgi:hypothetical protein
MANNDEFVERQYMNWIGRVLIVGLLLFSVVYLVADIHANRYGAYSDLLKHNLQGLVIEVCIIAWILCMRLDTVINKEGIYYRLRLFHFRFHFVPWSDMESVFTTSLPSWKKYRGWGIHIEHFRPRYKSYTVNGIKVVEMNLVSGKQIVVGTRRPEEIDMYIAKYFKKKERL